MDRCRRTQQLTTCRAAAVLVAALLLSAAHAHADAASGRAASLMPRKPTALSIKLQNVDFTFVPEEHAWDVSLRAELAPLTAAADVQLAIPEYSCDAVESEFDEGCDDTRTGFQHVEISLRGRPMSLRKTRAPDGAFWLLPLHVGAGESVPIEQHYRVPAGESGAGGFSASYLLRGTSLWGKPFGRSTFKFVFPARSCLIVEPQGVPRKSRRVVAKDGVLWLEATYEAYQWLPTQDVSLYFEPCEVVRDTELAGCKAGAALSRFFYPAADEEGEPIAEPAVLAELVKLSDAELVQCRDAVFNAYASYFQPGELKKLPMHPQAARHYTAPLLTAADWAWVKLLDQQVAAREAAKVAAAKGGKPSAVEPAKQTGCGCSAIGDREQASPVGLGGLTLTLTLTWLARRRRGCRSIV